MSSGTPREVDIQRWLQLLLNGDLLIEEFFVLGNYRGFSAIELLERVKGMHVTVTIRNPMEKNK